MQPENKLSDKIIVLADKYLEPYEIAERPLGKIIVPEYCPFCHGLSHKSGAQNDKKTFWISLTTGYYGCKRGGCGVHGFVSTLAAHLGENETEFSALAPKIEQLKAKTYDLPSTEILPVTEEIYKYFELRKISRKTVDAFKIGADKDGNIVFRFFDDGVDVFEKFRKPCKHTSGPKEWRIKNTKSILFGMDMCVFSKPLVICEGEIDAMALYEAGIFNVVSVPSGCEDLNWIDNCWSWLEKFKTIILFGDNDEPGKKMVREVVKRLDEARCLVVENYPQIPSGTRECKDANEVLFFYDETVLVEMVEQAVAIPVRGLLNLADVTPYDPTTVPRIKTGIPAIDSITGGLLQGGITVLLGKSGSGKSILSGLIMLNAIEEGNVVCAYSGEFRADRFQEWINLQAAGSDYIGLKYDRFKNKNVPVVPFDIQKRIMEWYDGKLLLFDNNENFTKNNAEAILQIFSLAIRRNGAKLLVVDNLMTSVSDREDEWKAQAVFSNQLKQMAVRFGVSVVLVCHARKTKSGEALRKDDLSGASAVMNLADLAITVEPGHLNVIKNRDTGVLKTVDFCYCPDSRRLYEADTGDQFRFSWNTDGVTLPEVRADSMPEYQVIPPLTEPF